MGNIHTDPWNYAHLIEDGACIVSPIPEFHFSDNRTEEPPVFTVIIPHCVGNIATADLQVRVWNETEDGAQCFSHQREGLQTDGDIRFRYDEKFVHITTTHLSTYLIAAKGLRCCCRSVELLFFTQMPTDSALNLKAFIMLSRLFSLADYRQV